MKWGELFTILESYGLKRYDVYAEHDLIYFDLPAGIVSNIMTGDDWARLREFGLSYGDDDSEGLYINV